MSASRWSLNTAISTLSAHSCFRAEGIATVGDCRLARSRYSPVSCSVWTDSPFAHSYRPVSGITARPLARPVIPSGHEALYRGPVSSPRVPGGVVHKLPGDLRKALIANFTALDAWKDITPLARNEFICWVEDAKQEMTRQRRIRRTQEELEEGQRRPCCWPGCKHRERIGR